MRRAATGRGRRPDSARPPFLANPDLVERIRTGAPVNPLRDLHLYLGGETGYTDYPVLAAVVHQPEALELAGAC